MRLKEDSNSWKARGVIYRDFRHTHGDPEIDRTKKKSKKKRPPKNRHKHVWVKVNRKEWSKYAGYYDRGWVNEPWWWDGDTTYFVCCDCLTTKRTHDKRAWRAHYRKR